MTVYNGPQEFLWSRAEGDAAVLTTRKRAGRLQWEVTLDASDNVTRVRFRQHDRRLGFGHWHVGTERSMVRECREALAAFLAEQRAAVAACGRMY